MDDKQHDELAVSYPNNLGRIIQVVENWLSKFDVSRSDDRFRDGLRQFMVSLGIQSFSLHIGFHTTFPTILFPQLKTDPYQNSWIAGLLSAGTPIGALLVGTLLDRFGRKRTTFSSAALTAITWAMIALLPANFDLKLLYAIRFMAGVAVGAISGSVIVYSSEMTNKHWRSVFLAVSGIYIAGAALITTTVGLLMPWRSFAFFNFIVSLFNMVILLAIPESPSWLLQSQPEKAEQIVMKLNKNKQDFNEEWESLKARRLARGSTLAKTRLLSREVRRPMLHLALVFICQQFSGAGLICLYAYQIFQTIVHSFSIAPPTTDPANNQTLVNLTLSIDRPSEDKFQFRFNNLDTLCLIGVGVIRFLMSIVTVILSKRANNRSILISSAAGAAVSAFAFSAVFSRILGPVKDIVPLSLSLLFLLLHSLGMLVVPWALIGELIPLSYRAKGSGIMTAFFNILIFFTIRSYPYAVDLLGLSGVFALFGMFATFSCFHVYFYIPETRGKTSNEIEDFFK